MLVYCDVLVDGEAVRHEFFGSTKTFIPEVIGSVDGMKKDDKVTLKVSTDLTRAGSKVKIKALFANGKALVKEVGFDQKLLSPMPIPRSLTFPIWKNNRTKHLSLI